MKKCNLCGEEGGHSFLQCTKYSSAKEKRERIRELKGCIKCGFLNHTDKNCKFKFKFSCRLCKGWHLSVLCSESEKEETSSQRQETKSSEKKDSTRKNSNETQNGMTWTEQVVNSGISGDCILPIFTCKLRNGKILNGLQDSGCQLNFILETAVQDCEFKILDENYSVIVNGFNSSKEYITKLIKIDIVLGGKIYKINAICVPQIPIKILLPDLGKVVSKFKKLGFKLANENFNEDSNEISDIEFILGTDSSYCIPASTVIFGRPTPSCYLNTPLGVMLTGNVQHLLKNIKYLEKDINHSDPNCPKFIPDQKSTISEEEELVKLPQIRATFAVINESGEIDEKELMRATEEVLEGRCSAVLQLNEEKNEDNIQVNEKLVSFVLDQISREPDGRLIMPLMWKGEFSQLLGENFNLSKQILLSKFEKVLRVPLKNHKRNSSKRE